MQAQLAGRFLRSPVNARAITVRVALLVVWMAAIFAFSAQPGQGSSALSDALAAILQRLGLGIPTELLTFLLRKAAHAFAYFVLGVLIFRLLQLSTLSRLSAALGSLAFVLVYAISDELHQVFVPGRSGEVRDVLIDVTAGAVGILLMALMHRFARRAKPTE